MTGPTGALAPTTLTATSADGTAVHATQEGHGPPILVLHPGLDDGASWARVAALLAPRHRVIRINRRPYRLDLPSEPRTAMAREVEDVHAVVDAAGLAGTPALLVGHSSGAVVALEALAAHQGAFAGAVLYEPPVVIGPPLGGEAFVRARAAIGAGKPGQAIAIFVRDVVRERAWIAPLVRVSVGMNPRMRAFAPRQIDEVEAIDLLGNRLDAYAGISVPVVLLGGTQSPAHLGERLGALQRVLPHSERVTLPHQGHAAHARAPQEVARVIAEFAERVLP